MAFISYPFIDLAVLDGVREHLAAGHAVLVMSENLDTVLLANAEGSHALGFEGPFDIVSEDPQLGISAQRQIRALDLQTNAQRAFSIGLRLTAGVDSRMLMVNVGSATLPGGETAVVLSWPSESASKDAIIRSMADDSTHFAVLDKSGSVIAASEQFNDLQISEFDLAQLATQTLLETDRMVKRRLKAGVQFIPVGMGRLQDEPALFIMLAIGELDKREGSTSETTSMFEQPVEALIANGPEYEVATEVEVIPNIENDQLPSETLVEETNISVQSAEPVKVDEIAPEIHSEAASQPVRFTWKIDAEGKFSYVSPEFAGIVGDHAANIVGRSFKEVANVFAFDPSGEIVDLLARRDTWSGRSVLWPIEGTDMRAPVDLAALPAYDRDRKFEGFRGFGIVRIADAVVDPEELGLALIGAQQTPVEDVVKDAHLTEDPWQGELPAITITEPAAPVRQDDNKVVQLGEHRLNKDKQIDASDKGQLTPIERNAFREIADRLRRDGLSIEPEVQADEESAAVLIGTVPSQKVDEADLVSDYLYDEGFEIQEPASLDDLTDLAKLDGATSETIEAEGIKAEEFDSDYRLPFDPDADTTPKHSSDDAPILSKLPVPVLIHNGAHLLYGNPAFFELTQYTSLAELEHEGGIEHLLHVSSSENENGSSSKIVMADNNEIPVRAHLHSVRWKGEHALLLSLRPVDEAQKPVAETNDTIERLNREVAELSSVLETATDGVVFVNIDGTIRSINQSAEALFGFDPAAVSGKPFTHLLATESQKTANDYIANLAGTGVASLINDGREVIGREARGRFIPLFMTIGKLDADTGYCVVLRDITQWKRAEEDLSAAKRAAEHASTQKSEFLARVSHEIRTPLNAIIGFSDMMSEERFGPVGNARYLDYLNDINRSGRHVLDLVNDLLDISKIEAGQQEMNFESVGLNEALAEAVSIMQPQANRERVIIRSSFATELPDVVADLRSIKQIALNLLANAVRYTGAGGQVIVSTSYELTGGVAIRVRDTGVGMSAQDIEQALKPFKQINTLKRERGDGTGLGLPLTKAMVEANRASFIISSTPGQGTLIEITFPSTRVLAE
jgi:PAS domain S-box-containing protein